MWGLIRRREKIDETGRILGGGRGGGRINYIGHREEGKVMVAYICFEHCFQAR
jgi:hypothetical protein